MLSRCNRAPKKASMKKPQSDFFQSLTTHYADELAQRLIKASALGLVLTLSACGGASNEPQSVSSSTSNSTLTTASNVAVTTGLPVSPAAQATSTDVAVGSITGFGSIIVNGIKYDDSSTTVSVDSDTEKSLAQTTADLKLGMQVELKHTAGLASEVLVASALRGPVTSVDAAQYTLLVLGQKVLVDVSGADATVLDGFASFADIKANDWIEVHATESADGSLKATRIERESAAQSTAIKIAGKLSALDSIAKTFKLGSTTINYANSTIRPAIAVLANDQRVYVFSDNAITAGVVNAKKIRIKDAKLVGVAQGNVAGLVTDFVSLSDFKVGGIKVDASKARFENGAQADLVNGAAVRIKGAVNSGVITASEIEFKKKLGAESSVISVKGTVSDFVSLSSFKLRGQTIDAANATFVGGKATDLANGSFVELQAQLVNGQIKAVKLTFIAQDKEGLTLNLAGLVQNYDKAAQTITIAGASLKLLDTTVFSGGVLADLANGKLVEVSVIRRGGVFEVRQLSFKNIAQIPLYLRGVAYDVTASEFKLAGVTISITAQTKFVGGVASDLSNGSNINMQAKLIVAPESMILATGGAVTLPSTAALPKLIAVQIELLQRPKADAALSVEGIVSDFTSIGNLRVAGQRVDASLAVIEGGVLGDITNGKTVQVTGQIVDGVVKASKLILRSS